MSGYKRLFSGFLAAVMLVGTLPTSAFAAKSDDKYQAPTHDTVIDDIAVGRYTSALNDGERLESSPVDNTEFIKISHPYTPGSAMNFDPTKNSASRAEHQNEIFSDGLLDYIGNGLVGVPGVDPGANGQGDRGQGYCWSALSYGDWMYTCLLYNSAGSTSDVMEEPLNPQELNDMYGGDYWLVEDDRDVPYSAVVKINVKTGEVVHLMSEGKNGINAQFRGAAKYKDKLYFIGSVNHLPSIYEIDPKTDAFQCVHQDEEMKNHPGGWQGAWMESRGKGICPTIRGITTFTNPADGEEYLVISCVGMDGNPYIAVSDNPSEGEFHKIGRTFADGYDIKYNPNAGPGELFGYAACDLRDSIMGGSIWEMAAIGNKLFVAICTGKPSNAKWHYRENHQEGDASGSFMTDQIIDSMQSFAIVVGEYNKDAGTPEDMDAWEWHSLAGDEKFDSKYTYGIDPERTRAGACNLNVFDGKLYVGEYNDTQIAFKNMANREYTFLTRNIEQSISLYRLDPETETFEKVMGNPTKMFPTALSGINESGFGKGENQYFWRSILFDGNGDGKDELYYGTFDETFVLMPIARMANEKQQGLLPGLLNDVEAMQLAAASDDQASVLSDAQLMDMAEADKTFAQMKADGLFVPKADEEAVRSGVLLPESVMEAEPLVKVDSVKDLYLAILSAAELIRENQGDRSVSETLVNVVNVLNLQEEIADFLKTSGGKVPAILRGAAVALADDQAPDAEPSRPQPPVDPEGPGRTENIQEIKVVLKHLAGSVNGFDMFRTDDGIHFTQITRNGMGDPYNQGLRVFAANNDPENAWMCLGTANPFYGAQVWRMQSGITNDKPVEPAQQIVALNFVDADGKPIKRSPADDHKAREVYVYEGADTLELADIQHMILDAYAVADGVTSVKIQTAEDGSKFVNIPLISVDKMVDVTIRFVPITGEDPIEKVISISAAKTSLQAGELISYLADTTDQWLLENDHAGVTIKNGKASVNVVSCAEMYTMKLVGGVLSDNVSSEMKYAPGQIISIRATNRNPRMVFDHWDVQGALDANEVKMAITSFVMPASDITLTSVYNELAMKQIVVNNGVALLGKKQGTIIVPALDENGREIPLTQAYKGQQIVVRTDPKVNAPSKRQGFVNWTYKNDYASGVILDDATRYQTYFTMPDKAVELTANYKNLHNVVVEGGQVSVAGSDYAPIGSAYAGQGVSLKAVVPEGKRFYMWEFTPDKVNNKNIVDLYAPETSFVMPEFTIAGLIGTQTLKAKARFLDAGQYLITLNKAYGSGSGNTILATENSVVPALPTPERDGWYFTGWFTQKLDGQQIKAGDILNKDVTLYAHWSKDKPVPPTPPVTEYTVTFDANGGKAEVNSLKTADGKLALLPGASREGYTFDGWFTKAEGGEKITVNTVYTADTTVYAHWTENEPAPVVYTVSFDANGGKAEVNSLKTVDGKLALLPNASREGYTFDGWFTKAEGGEKITVNTVYTADTTVYAHWTELVPDVPVQYDVTVKDSDHGKLIVSADKAEAGVRITITASPDAGYKLGLLAVRDESGNSLITDRSASTVAFRMPDSGVTAKAVFVKAGSSQFTDVKDTDWFLDSVSWGVENDITAGIGNNAFGPYNVCTRAQAMTLLWKFMGCPEHADVENPFTDVDESDWYYDAVMWAVENKITAGTSATTFGSDDPCSRAQIVTFIWRAMGEPDVEAGNPFRDVKEDDYFYGAIQWAVKYEVTAGTSATTFGPDDLCDRSQILTLLYHNELNR